MLELLERQHVHRLQRFHALLNHAQLLLQRLQAGIPQLIADLRQGVWQFSHLLLQTLSQSAALFREGLDLLGQALQFPLPLLLLLAQSRQAGFGRITGAALLTKALLQGLLLLLQFSAAGLIGQLLIAQFLHLSGEGGRAGLQALLLSGHGLELAVEARQHQTAITLGGFQSIALGPGGAQGRISLFKLLLQLTPTGGIG